MNLSIKITIALFVFLTSFSVFAVGQEKKSPNPLSGVEEAINHINGYSSGHTESIITNNVQTFEKFYNKVDSAIILKNASTQFADGGEFGFGAEIGISTDKIHVRGPVGTKHLTTFKYVVDGDGQERP